MRTILLVLGLLSAFALIGGGVYVATESAKKRQSDDKPSERAGAGEAPAGEPEPLDVSAAELEAAYKANEVRADSQYRDKPLRVTGTVDRISRDIRDDPHVILKSPDFLGGVTCSFGRGGDDQVMNLDRGQRIVVVGIGAGYAFGGPMLRACRVERAMGPPCQVPNANNTGRSVTGECKALPDCVGTYYQGFCEGPASIVCCSSR